MVRVTQNADGSVVVMVSAMRGRTGAKALKEIMSAIRLRDEA
jgi:hypothetical protein